MVLKKHSIKAPFVNMALGVISFFDYLASLFMLVSALLEFGFRLTDKQLDELTWLYFWVWIIFLIDRGSHLLLIRRGYMKSEYSFLGWSTNALLMLTLIPIIVEFAGIDDSYGIMRIIDNRVFHVTVLFVISLIDFSDGVIRLMGRKMNPALMLALSFMVFILVGSGLLMMPRCVLPGVHLSWIDSLFTATSAVCVTGLTTIDVPSTFTTIGQFVIMILIQVGGLGVMTITSFFALFFMGNTSLYNQILVRDMVSSKSLASLWSTLLNIFGFTAIIELVGALTIFLNIHGTIGQNLTHELFFSVFHSVSAFCNAGFSIYQDGLSSPVLMTGHCWLYIIISLLIILGGIGYPVLVNLKVVVNKRAVFIWNWICGRRYASMSIPNLYDLNTKIVLRTTGVLIIFGMLLIGFFEWNNTFDGMLLHEKIVQAFFNAVSPRTAGFISVNLGSMCIQSILVYTILMWIGGASQSTAGGVKVNAFAVAVLNVRAIIRGTTRVEFAGRELSLDSIRRANVAVFSSLFVLFAFIFAITIIEPHLPLKAIVFECVSAFGTVGSTLGITTELQDASKVLIIILMFLGRVGVVTLAQALLRQYKNQNYKLPQDNIIIS
jgi:Trk-type K+ transport system membrane component